MTIKILLADDHATIRQGLRNILDQASDMEVVGEAVDGPEAIEFVERLNPDVLLLDVEMPVLKGYQVARQLRHDGCPARVLALSGYNEKRYILEMFASGARGYLTKEEAPKHLIKAIKDIFSGRKGVISPRVAARLGVPITPVGRNTLPALSPLENQILTGLMERKTDQELMEEHSLDSSVLLECIQSIQRKLGASSRLEAIVRAMQEDLI